MWIDINASVGHWPFRKVHYNTCNLLMERMNRFNVDLSVISNLNGIFYKNTQSANEELHEEMRSKRRFANRFIPFAVINPIYAGWKNDLDTCVKKMGMKGVRMYPKYHDYEIADLISAFQATQKFRTCCFPVERYIYTPGQLLAWHHIP